MKETTITINAVTWTEEGHRETLPCVTCTTPTKGRIGEQAFCMECGMKKAFEPLKIFRKEVEG